MTEPCPLCQSPDCHAFFADKQRAYRQCRQCQLVFAEPASWPNARDEKALYDLHENSLEDKGYNRFLARIVDPLTDRVSPPAQLLDFGCGPAPALANQLRQLGFEVSLYDSFYYPETQALQHSYDAIVATEVIEHLHQPRIELERLWAHLQPGGWLALMTQRVIDAKAFKTWQYKNDPTHVCFFHERSFHWLAGQLNASQLNFEGRDMVFLQKPEN
ncbi:class I SAM-dependent methyltransferase [Reinekea marinisedimentorum]|uniref:Methyltransferase family protein n=1 Tax=Reinekea marinisedimentorum TaxID=230495 RepID=A0A4R3IB24_9GAMM|nr:class I SAM-dependent methyltransferase [Reinekea marinisedimentorum]TCS43799.1 methyltransferase family protein [Reinekea marinisedimentorum]